MIKIEKKMMQKIFQSEKIRLKFIEISLIEQIFSAIVF